MIHNPNFHARPRHPHGIYRGKPIVDAPSLLIGLGAGVLLTLGLMAVVAVRLSGGGLH